MMKNEKGYHCDLCGGFIIKYQMDLKCCEVKVRGNDKLVCDDCAGKIAEYVVGEF